MRIETEIEDDGRWIAEVADLPGVLAYGHSREEAVTKAKALALRIEKGADCKRRPKPAKGRGCKSPA